MSDEFVQFLLKDLNSVTNKGGTAYVSFSVLGNKVNDIGGKTGTAQNAGDKNNEEKSDDENENYIQTNFLLIIAAASAIGAMVLGGMIFFGNKEE